MKGDVFEKPVIISIGARYFYESIKMQTDNVVHVEWRPPAGGDEETMDILKRLKKKAGIE